MVAGFAACVCVCLNDGRAKTKGSNTYKGDRL